MEKTVKTKKTDLMTFSLENVEIPQFREWSVSGKDWYYWGKDNKLPYYLYQTQAGQRSPLSPEY